MRLVDGGDFGGMVVVCLFVVFWFEVIGMLKIFLFCCKDFFSVDNGFEVFIVLFDEF